MKKIKSIYYITLITFVTLINIILIFNNNVWCDEAFVMNACKLNFKELITFILENDMRPPVYLLAAKLFSLVFGLSVPVLKFFSIIPSILAMFLGATAIDKNWGNGKLYTGSIFILLMGLAPITLTKNIEISMYSWTTFFIVCSAVFAYNIVCDGQKKKDWIIFIISALGAATTHYYAVLAEIFIYFFLFVALLLKDRHNIKSCLFASIFTIIGYLPILPFFFHQFGVAKDTFWIKKTDFSTILSALRLPFQGENTFTFTSEFTMIFWALILGSCIHLITICVKNMINKEKLNSTILFPVLCIFVISSFLISCLILSNIIRPLFVNRYMYVVISLLWLYVAIVFGSTLSERTEKKICIGLIICFIIFSFPTIIEREYNTGTDKAVEYLNKEMSEGDILINNIEECMNWSLNYYFPEHEAYLDRDINEFYKNESFDFSSLNTTAWYLCNGTLEISEDTLESENLSCEVLTADGFVPVNLKEEIKGKIVYNLDNYYYFYIYKITKN